MAREARHFVDEAFFVAFCANFGNSWFVTLSVKNSMHDFGQTACVKELRAIMSDIGSSLAWAMAMSRLLQLPVSATQLVVIRFCTEKS